MTERERHAAADRMITDGYTVEEIAPSLSVSIPTINRWTKVTRELVSRKRQEIIHDSTLTTAEAAEKAGYSQRNVQIERSKRKSDHVSKISPPVVATIAPMIIDTRPAVHGCAVEATILQVSTEDGAARQVLVMIEDLLARDGTVTYNEFVEKLKRMRDLLVEKGQA